MQQVMERLTEQLAPLFGSYIPNLVGAMAILFAGWVVAFLLASGVRIALHRSTLDARLAGWIYPGEKKKAVDVQTWTGRAVFYLIMLFVVVGMFQSLQLTIITEPLNRLLTEVFQFLPRLVSAGLLLGIAWLLATVLRAGMLRVLNAVNLDRRLSTQVSLPPEGAAALSTSIGDVVYWLILLLFIPAVLDALALEGLLGPVNSMVNGVLGFLPNLFAAGLILLVGWFMARIIQRTVTSLLAAAGTDRLGERVGLNQVLGERGLSGAVGLILYVLILLPVLIGVLNALQLEAITQPASHMLGLILGAVPNIVGAALVLTVAYIVGRVVATIGSNVLAGIGFDAMWARMGFTPEVTAGSRPPSAIAGLLILVTIMLFSGVEAARLLGFVQLASLVAQFTVFGGHLLLGLVIVGIGLYLANLASGAIQGSRTAQARLFAKAVYTAILVLATAMALRQMGLADEIVNLAFGLILGSLAIAFALALGLGGRDIAAAELKAWLASIRSK